jgi:hypothetical protein
MSLLFRNLTELRAPLGGGTSIGESTPAAESSRRPVAHRREQGSIVMDATEPQVRLGSLASHARMQATDRRSSLRDHHLYGQDRSTEPRTLVSELSINLQVLPAKRGPLGPQEDETMVHPGMQRKNLGAPDEVHHYGRITKGNVALQGIEAHRVTFNVGPAVMASGILPGRPWIRKFHENGGSH